MREQKHGFSWSGASADVISEQLVLSRELRQLLLQYIFAAARLARQRHTRDHRARRIRADAETRLRCQSKPKSKRDSVAHLPTEGDTARAWVCALAWACGASAPLISSRVMSPSPFASSVSNSTSTCRHQTTSRLDSHEIHSCTGQVRTGAAALLGVPAGLLGEGWPLLPLPASRATVANTP